MRPEILTNLLKAKLIILLLISYSVLCGQDIYESRTMLKGGSLSTNIPIQDIHVVVKEPVHGTVTFHSIGFLCKFLIYTPHPDFTGKDSVVLEIRKIVDGETVRTYKAFEYIVKGILAHHDYYLLEKDSTYELNVLSNDFISGEEYRIVNTVKLNANDADVVVDNNTIFTHYSGEDSELYLRYILCNNLEECDDAYVNIKFANPLKRSSNDTIVRYLKGGEELFMVFGFDKFTYLRRPSKGYIITHKPNVLKYIPYANQSVNDTISVQKTEGEFIKTQTYIIHIEPEINLNNFVADDFFRTSINSSIEFNVFGNDLFDTLQIDSFSYTDTGVLHYLNDGKFLFEPESGYAGNTEFHYRVCIGINCEWAKVILQVVSLAPQLNNYTLTTSKNSPLIIRFNSDFEMFTYNFLSLPNNGTLDYYPGYHEDEISGKEFSGYNLMVYTPSDDFTGKDLFYLDYCTVPEEPCKHMSISIDVLDYQPIEFCLDDCIWPGDANNDGIVSGLDLLSLGYNMGETGQAREVYDMGVWIGQQGQNWERTQGVLPIDMKFIDSDGNGEITFEDVNYVDEYYLNTHAFHVIQEVSLNSNDFHLILPEDSLFVGDTASFFIIIGSEDDMVQSMNGFTFNLDFDENIIDEESLQVEFINNNFFFDNAPIVDLVKQPYSGRLDVAASRLTKDPVGGFGMAVKASFIVIDDIDGFKIDRPDDNILTKLTLHSVLSMDGLGGVTRSSDATHNLVIHRRKRDIENPTEQRKAFVFVSPNPTTDEVHIVTDNFSSNNIRFEIFTAQGQLVQTGESDNFSFQLKLGTLPSGFYILNITDGINTVQKKIQKVK